jgi:hypothetical protein
MFQPLILQCLLIHSLLSKEMYSCIQLHLQARAHLVGVASVVAVEVEAEVVEEVVGVGNYQLIGYPFNTVLRYEYR